MSSVEQWKAVANILKGHFPNLTVQITLDIAGEIIQALEDLEK